MVDDASLAENSRRRLFYNAAHVADVDKSVLRAVASSRGGPNKEIGRNMSKPPAFKKNRPNRKRAKAKVHSKKRDPLAINGERPRPMFVDYKDVELLKKLTSRQGKIISRRKTGCSAVSQHAVAAAVKRARFMALMPYVGD